MTITITTRVALITGASRGLGLALARELAKQNWRLIITARGMDALQTAKAELGQSTEILSVVGDIADSENRQQIVKAVDQFGCLDVVINNASILGPSPQPHLLDYPIDVLESVFQTNVIAPLAILQGVRQYLSQGARIINITSDAGIEAYEGWGGYGSSKSALNHQSAILALENPNYKVYWVDPGDMQTQMHQEAFPNEDISDRPLPEVIVPGFLRLLEENLPSGRYHAQVLAKEVQL